MNAAERRVNAAERGELVLIGRYLRAARTDAGPPLAAREQRYPLPSKSLEGLSERGGVVDATRLAHSELD